MEKAVSPSAIPAEPVEPPTYDELEAMAETAVVEEPQETFSAVVPAFEDEIPEEERRRELRRELGMRAPEWAVDLGITKGTAAFEGPTGELVLTATTTAVFTDRAAALRRLSAYLLSKGVDRFVALGLLHGWAAHFCAPVPFEYEIVGVFEEVLRDGIAT